MRNTDSKSLYFLILRVLNSLPNKKIINPAITNLVESLKIESDASNYHIEGLKGAEKVKISVPRTSFNFYEIGNVDINSETEIINEIKHNDVGEK